MLGQKQGLRGGLRWGWAGNASRLRSVGLLDALRIYGAADAIDAHVLCDVHPVRTDVLLDLEPVWQRLASVVLPVGVLRVSLVKAARDVLAASYRAKGGVSNFGIVDLHGVPL